MSNGCYLHVLYYKSFAGNGQRMCSNEERLAMVDTFCANTKGYRDAYKLSSSDSTAENGDELDRMTDEDILRISHDLWMDPTNHVILCMHAKVGCTTWKTILANNTSEKPLYDIRNIHGAVFRAGMLCADAGRNATQIRHRLRTWYKFVIVRHPFDR